MTKCNRTLARLVGLAMLTTTGACGTSDFSRMSFSEAKKIAEAETGQVCSIRTRRGSHIKYLECRDPEDVTASRNKARRDMEIMRLGTTTLDP